MSETVQKKAAEAQTLVAEVTAITLPEPVAEVQPLDDATTEASAEIKTPMP